MYIPIIKQLSCTADFRNISNNFSNLSVTDILCDIFHYFISICQEAELACTLANNTSLTTLNKTPSSKSVTLQIRHLLNSFTRKNILNFVTCSPVIELMIVLVQLITFDKITEQETETMG